jgi:hypothetical protein
MIVEPIGTTRAVARTDARNVRRAARVLFAATLAALIAGCASPPRGGEPRDLVCNSAQQCRVTVRVDCAGGCRAIVDHPRVHARGNDVVWIIDNKPGQNYMFRPSDGVAFKSEAGRAVFRCHAEAAGNRYACMNQRTPGEYEYGIHLDGAPAVPPLDPWIVN